MRVLFGDVALDSLRRQLLRAGVPVTLTPKAYRLLELLLERRPGAVSKFDIQEALWPKTFVADSNLRALVNEVRAAIGDAARSPRFVRTVYGFGYAFAGEASAAPGSARGATGLVHTLRRGGEVLELAEGETILGRDSEATVWVGDESASRRHARITVDRESAVLEDLGSKNGTWVGDERLVAPRRLTSGVDLRIGSVTMSYRTISVRASTRTRKSKPSARP